VENDFGRNRLRWKDIVKDRKDVSARTGLNCLKWKAKKLIQRESKRF
jgi:hypothetical protein